MQDKTKTKIWKGAWRNLANKNLGRRQIPDRTAQATDTLLCSDQLHDLGQKLAIIKKAGQNLNVTADLCVTNSTVQLLQLADSMRTL